jgi:serine/threonine-protein kinase
MNEVGEYIIINKIGEGRYGIAYLVEKNSKYFILKQLKKKMLKVLGSKVNYEKELLSNIDHVRIPKLIDTVECDENIYYVLEYMYGKTFEELIYKDNYIFTRREIFDVALQLIDTIKYLHERNIVHRDIRISNVIMNNGEISLLDFGLARKVNNLRYKYEVDFYYLADFLLHLYYTSFDMKSGKGKPWYEELDLTPEEKLFLEKLFGLKEQYINIKEIEEHFFLLKVRQL